MKIVQTRMKIATVSSFSVCFIVYVFIEIIGGYSAAHTFLYPIRMA